MRKRWQQLALGFAVSIIALALALRGASLDAFVQMVHRVRPGPLALSLILYFAVTLTFRSAIVVSLLRSLKRVGIAIAYRYILIGFLANNVLPVRLGEIVRAALLGLRVKLPMASVIAALALERMLDLSMVVLLTVAASAVAPVPAKLKVAAAVTAIGLLVLFGVLSWAVRTRRPLSNMLPSWVSEKVSGFLGNQIQLFSQGLVALKDRRHILTAAAASAGLWISMIPVLNLRMAAFGLDLPAGAGLFMLVALTFSLALPSMPGYIGVYHLAVVFSLSAFGVRREEAVALALLFHLLDVGSISIAGCIALAVEGLGWKSLTGLGSFSSRKAEP